MSEIPEEVYAFISNARTWLASRADNAKPGWMVAKIDAVEQWAERTRALSQLEAGKAQEPLVWIYEDELPLVYPYNALFPYSKVDGVRMFPIYGPALTSSPAVEAGENVFQALVTSAKMLQQNAVSCATNHYGEDFSCHGLPGWLRDTQKTIVEAEAALASPSPALEAEPVKVTKAMVKEYITVASLAKGDTDACIKAGLKAVLALSRPTPTPAVDADAVIEALRPFADTAGFYDPPEGDDKHVAWAHDFPIGALRRARDVFRALSLPPSADKGE